MRLIILQRVYSGICVLLAGMSAWMGDPYYLSTTACAVFLATAVFVLRRSELGAWLSGFTGALLVLYTIAVLLWGWEYLGGALGTIATALVTGCTGALGIYLASEIHRPSKPES